MKHLGIIGLPGRGHLHPATALGRRLQTRGYRITVFGPRIISGIVKAAGLDFCPIEDKSANSLLTKVSATKVRRGPNAFLVMQAHALSVLQKAPDAMSRAKVDALLVDQADWATGTVADRLGIPFATMCFLPPLYLNDEVPPFFFGWLTGGEPSERRRNRRGNNAIRRLLSPTLDLVREYRRLWGLPPKNDVNDFLSDRAIITQLPAILDFPRTVPSHLFYTGSFSDESGRPTVEFPWHLLGDKRLIYASMGTVRNDSVRAFRMIAEACAGFDAQLVIALGGMTLQPSNIGPLPGSPIVVHYAPQNEILRRSALTITHAGVNTTLESLASGVPMMAIPITDDQPGMAARICWLGVGDVLPFRRLCAARLRDGIEAVLSNSKYRNAACRVQSEMQKIDGLERATQIIEARVLQ